MLEYLILHIIKTRKGMIIALTIVTAICTFVAASLLIEWEEAQKQKELSQLNFNTLRMDQLKDGQAVQGTIDKSFGTYAETYSTSGEAHNSEELFYILPIYQIDGEQRVDIKYFITFKAVPKDFETMDKIVEQTFTDTPGHTELSIKNGIITPIPEEYKKYLKEWMETPDFYENGSFIDWCIENNIFGTNDRDVIESNVVSFMIYETDAEKSGASLIWIFFAGLAALSLTFLLVLICKKPTSVEPTDKDLF